MEPLIDASTTSQEYEENINVTLKRLQQYVWWFRLNGRRKYW